MCALCDARAHFTCAYGAPLASARMRTYFLKGKYVCPICVVGRNSDLVLKAVSVNQQYLKNKVTEFSLPTSLIDAAADWAQEENAAAEELSHNEVLPVPDDHTADHDNLVAGGENRTPPPVNTTVVNTTVACDPNEGSAFIADDMAPPHNACVGRSKKLSYILRALHRVPHHPSTVFIGDSHLHGVDGKDIDPIDDQVRVRSIGGLCVVAAVTALMQHKFVHKKFRSVVWVLGTNDALHAQEHCLDDRVKYLRMLYTESVRVFPSAVIHLVTPFSGLRGISESYLSDLVKDLKFACQRVKVHRPPSVRNKISRQGIHLNKEGREVFLAFLRSRFVRPKQRVFNSDSGRKGTQQPPPAEDSQGHRATYAEALAPKEQQQTVLKSDIPSNDTLPSTYVQHGRCEPPSQTPIVTPRPTQPPHYVPEYHPRATIDPPDRNYHVNVHEITALVINELFKHQQRQEQVKNYRYAPPPPIWSGY